MLVVNNVSISYGDRLVLSDVSFAVAPGEVVALVGPNGVGKSSLGRVLCGMRLASGGSIVVDGVDPAAGEDARNAVRALVGYVFQDPADQIVSTVVYDEVAFGPRNLGLPEDEVTARVAEALELAQLSGFEQRNVETLSGGELQRLALAGVLAMRPRYLVLDEVLSQLDPQVRPRLRALFSALAHEHGVGVITITHDRDDRAAADRTIDLSFGKSPKIPMVQSIGNLGLLLKPQVEGSRISRMDGSNEQNDRDFWTFAKGAPLVAQGVTYSYGRRGLVLADTAHTGPQRVLDGADLELACGEAVLLEGPSGAGKSTFACLLAGLYEPQAGQVLVKRGDGTLEPVHPGMVGLAFQRPEAQLFCDTVFDEVAFGPRNEGLAEDVVRERVLAACGALGIHEGMLDAYPFELSGGWQRRVGLAGVIALDAPAYVFDEPTAGLDARGREELHLLVDDLRAAGKAVLIISHDVDEWAPLVDRMLTLREGRLVERLVVEDRLDATRSAGAGVMGLEAGSQPQATAAPVDRREAHAEQERATRSEQGDALGCSRSPQGHSTAICGGIVPTASRQPFLEALDARVKLAWFMGLTVVLFAAPGAMGLVGALALLAACARACRISVQDLARVAKPAAAVLVLTLLANLVRLDGSAPIAIAGPVGLDLSGGVRGAAAVARIVVLAGYALVVGASTTPQQMSDAMVRLLRPLSRVGIPVGALGTALALALRFIPLTMGEYDRLRMAQRARGAAFDEGPLLARIKLHIAILVPLIAGLMRRADNLADAMAARLYDPRGAVRVPKASLNSADLGALACLGVMLAVVFAARVLM